MLLPHNLFQQKVLSSQPHAITPITPNLPAGMPASQAQNDKIASPATPLKDPKALTESQKDKQVLLDLVELAGEGMTLTQWNAGPSNQTGDLKIHNHPKLCFRLMFFFAEHADYLSAGRESPVSIACSGFIPAEEVTRKDSLIPDTNKVC